MKLTPEFLELIKQSNPIEDVMTEYVELKRAGGDYVCVCPFHADKNPSCHIYVNSQSFHCFGCGAGGDVINFLRLINNYDFIDSVKALADRAGIMLPDDEDNTLAKKRARLLQMNLDAAKYFSQVLFSPQGKPGLDYLLSRGFTEHTIRKYGLGFAQDGWINLKKHLNSLRYSDEEIAEASLLNKSSKTGKYYDFFINRVMFPFIDLKGNIIGFTGRTIGDDPRKYLNSKETQVFKKNEFLYSYNYAVKDGKDFLILCEGNLDVIAMYQAGFRNAIATCGTAITDKHAKEIAKKGFKQVILAFDNDNAGKKATTKATNILDKAGIKTKVLLLHDAKDPDEYIKKFGADTFRELLNNSKSSLQYAIDNIQSEYDISTPEGKSDYLKKSIEFIASIENEIDRQIYISQVAKQCEVNPDNIRHMVGKRLNSKQRQENTLKEKALIRTTDFSGDKINKQAHLFPTETKAEYEIIAFLIHSPENAGFVNKRVSESDFCTDFSKKIFYLINSLIEENGNADLSVIGMYLPGNEISYIYNIMAKADQMPYSKERLMTAIHTLVQGKKNKQAVDPANMSDKELEEFFSTGGSE